MKMQLIKENTTRKIDSLGRVSIPKSMRDRMYLKEGDEVEFFMLMDEDTNYVAFGRPREEKEANGRFARAAEVLAELGLEVPEELLEKC